jgi:2,3-bisphosphoglycerate-dependent phosphoglycerate mutase
MKTLILILFSIVSNLIVAQKQVTTYYFIRHAEKVDNSKNPQLSEAGKLRAENYKKIFSNIKLDKIYSTDFIRTTTTVNPTALDKNLIVTIYNPKEINFDSFKRETLGQKILVVGHSNSTPDFVNKIINEKTYANIDETIFGYLYIVTIIDDKVTHQLLVLP